MASSLFNDYANVNDMIKKLIDVAELLYSKKDTLLDKILRIQLNNMQCNFWNVQKCNLL